MAGGKLELFGNITDMISQWERMEGKEERVGGDRLLDKRGRKRLSKVIIKLSGRFEEREEGHESQPDVMCRGEREQVSTISFSNLVNMEEFKTRRKNTANDAKYQFSNVINVSTNEKSRSNQSISRKCVTNQSGDIGRIRKRKASWRDDNPGTKKSKMDGVQLGV